MININKNCALIRSCKVTISINVKQCGQFFKKKLLASGNNMILPRSKIMIPLIPVFLPSNCDFLFHPIIQANLILYAYIFDYTTTKILVSNTFDYPLYIPRHQKLGHIIDICYENYFSADTQATFNFATFPPRAQPFFDLHAGIILALTDTLMETQLDNNMRVYGDKVVVRKISELIVQYLSIWEFKGFVQILSEYWIKVYLKFRWESKVSVIKLRVYPFGNNSRHVINKTFDEIYRQDRLKFTINPISFSFSIFVI